MSKTYREDYKPKNRRSKRYSSVKDESGYEAGGYCRGHKSRTADNQSLNQLIRTREKREVKNLIEYDREDITTE